MTTRSPRLPTTRSPRRLALGRGAWLLPLALLPAIAGCHTTKTARDDAARLAADLQAYRDEQAARVRRINREYHDAFAALMDALDQLSDAQTRQARDGDAQQIADALIADGGATLRGRFRDAFAAAVAEQRRRIREADLAVAAVKEDYEKSYADARLEMAKLDKAIANLRALSEEDVDEVREAGRLIRIIVDAYKEAARKPAETETAANAR